MSFQARIRSGLFWSGGSRLVAQVLNWAITVVVIRLLSPSDYGLMAMATVFVSFLTLLAGAGLAEALVQAREVNDRTLRGALAAVILMDLSLFALQYLAAPSIARFFEEPRLIAIVRVLALQFVVSIFSVIPSSLLARALDFRPLSLAQLASSVFGSISTLVLALLGQGVWALAIGTLVSQLVSTLAVNLAAPFLKWPDFSMPGLGSLIRFGGQMMAARILWLLYSQADVLIAGKLLGKDLLGYYSVSMHLASMPVQRVSAIINQVAFPAFASIQDDAKSVSSYVFRAFGILSFVGFPVFLGISSIAPELVDVVLGTRWTQAIIPLQLLALIMPLRLIGNFLPSAVDGVGRPDISLKNLAWACAIMPPAFLVGAHSGLAGMSLAWALVFPLVFLLNVSRALPVLGLRVRDLLHALSASAFCGAAMYGAVSAARFLAAGQISGIALLALLVVVGVVTYGALVLAFNRGPARELASLLMRRQGSRELA
jgi:O-antigen/teichoic acid export membrane protein